MEVLMKGYMTSYDGAVGGRPIQRVYICTIFLQRCSCTVRAHYWKLECPYCDSDSLTSKLKGDGESTHQRSHRSKGEKQCLTSK